MGFNEKLIKMLKKEITEDNEKEIIITFEQYSGTTQNIIEKIKDEGLYVEIGVGGKIIVRKGGE